VSAGRDPSPRPPSWAEKLLHLCLPAGLLRDSVLGDMAEELALRERRSSARAARRWYARQALGVALRYVVFRAAPSSSAAPSTDNARLGDPSMLRSLGQDLGNALRSLLRARSFVIPTVLTLALGVGATTAIFSVVDGVLLRPLPYPDPDRLVVLRNSVAGANHSEPEFWDYTRDVDRLASVAAYRESSPVLGSAEEPERIPVILASSTLIPMLGVEPLLGRTYSADEDVAGARDRVVVLSHDLWMRVFGGDPSAVGRTIILEDVPHTVVGVMPAGFGFPAPGIQAWAPLRLDPADPWARNNHYLDVVARLASGASMASADAQLDALGAHSTEAYPRFYSKRVTFLAMALRDDVVGDVRTPLLLLLGAVVGVLLIASVNAAALFLARGEGRRAEVAVRAALGAGRARVVGQLLGESLLVAILAGIVGAGLAFAGVATLKRLAPADLPRLGEVGVDARVLLFGLATALVTGLAFGLAPAVQAVRSDVRDVLASGAWGGIGSRRSGRVRRGLVVAQLGLATMLALGAGLMLRSFAALRGVDLGLHPEGVLTMAISPSVSRVAVDTAAVAFYQQLEDRVRTLPGVAAVGSAYRLPLADGSDNYSIQLEEHPTVGIGDAPAPGIQWATPGYFAAMGIQLERGRLFTRADDSGAPLVAVVNDRLARELWPGQDAVGKRLRMFGEAHPWVEVVGVVADVKHYGIRRQALAKLYVPHLQGYVRGAGYYSPNRMNLIVRTGGDPAALAAPVRAVVKELAPGVPIVRVRTMADVVSGALSRERFTMLLLGAFSSVALLLAAVGVYGVIAQAVVTRTREIGLRMAVGAARGDVARAVLREGMALAVLGTALGLAGGAALSRLMRSILYQVSPVDPWTFAAAVPILALAAALACLVPALRAARLDPVKALRDE
jgi:putative ABC transport system permease protein